ncbi:MAG: transcription antitermination protein NusB [Rikenellaceae bacterium]
MLSRRLLRIKVLKALYAHLQSDGDNMVASEKSMMSAIDKSYDLYFQLLQLPTQISQYIEERQEIAKKKHITTYEDLNPNTKIQESAFIQLMDNADSINDYVSVRKLGWVKYPELIKTLHSQLSQSDYFKKYMASPERSIKEDVAMWEKFFVEEVQNCELLDDVIEEQSLMWSSDLSFVLPLVLRTLSSIRPSHTDIKVAKKFKSDEDREFVRTLFQKSLINFNRNQAYIEKFTSNWDVERIVFMDNLIMVIAMSELVSFPEIPKKVTLDEYIEVSKFYSTPGSSVFINGILDKMAIALTEEGEIVKVGRGLM